MVVLLGIRLNSHGTLAARYASKREGNEAVGSSQVLGGSGVVLVSGCGVVAFCKPMAACGLVAG
jgi:hypothetical protein